MGRSKLSKRKHARKKRYVKRRTHIKRLTFSKKRRYSKRRQKYSKRRQKYSKKRRYSKRRSLHFGGGATDDCCINSSAVSTRTPIESIFPLRVPTNSEESEFAEYHSASDLISKHTLDDLHEICKSIIGKPNEYSPTRKVRMNGMIHGFTNEYLNSRDLFPILLFSRKDRTNFDEGGAGGAGTAPSEGQVFKDFPRTTGIQHSRAKEALELARAVYAKGNTIESVSDDRDVLPYYVAYCFIRMEDEYPNAYGQGHNTILVALIMNYLDAELTIDDKNVGILISKSKENVAYDSVEAENIYKMFIYFTKHVACKVEESDELVKLYNAIKPLFNNPIETFLEDKIFKWLKEQHESLVKEATLAKPREVWWALTGKEEARQRSKEIVRNDLNELKRGGLDSTDLNLNTMLSVASAAMLLDVVDINEVSADVTYIMNLCCYYGAAHIITLIVMYFTTIIERWFKFLDTDTVRALGDFDILYSLAAEADETDLSVSTRLIKQGLTGIEMGTNGFNKILSFPEEIISLKKFIDNAIKNTNVLTIPIPPSES